MCGEYLRCWTSFAYYLVLSTHLWLTFESKREIYLAYLNLYARSRTIEKQKRIRDFVSVSQSVRRLEQLVLYRLISVEAQSKIYSTVPLAFYI
jgi:hypothetical protein